MKKLGIRGYRAFYGAKKFLTGQTRRLVKHHREAKALYDSGKLGEPLFAEASYIHNCRKVFDRSPWRYEVPQEWKIVS